MVLTSIRALFEEHASMETWGLSLHDAFSYYLEERAKCEGNMVCASAKRIAGRAMEIATLPFAWYAYCNKLVFSQFLYILGNTVDDLQSLTDNPNEDAAKDPTHSQLAKDHDNHPFHTLAARLASEAVKQVGTAMFDCWKGDKSADPVKLARLFIRHPYDYELPAQAGEPDCAALIGIIRAWAGNSGNAGKIGTGKSLSGLHRLHEKYREAKDWLSKNEGRNYKELYKNKLNPSLWR
jgi:hypothetical protein